LANHEIAVSDFPPLTSRTPAVAMILIMMTMSAVLLKCKTASP
jgi:hypothetical protein